MIADIDTAEKWVNVEFFILVMDKVTEPFFQALERACQRGVKVRVLSDHVAQIGYPNRKECMQRFAAMGAEYHPMLPINPLKGEWRRPDLRNHRKIVIVDGKVAHTGSQNLTDRSYNKPKNIQRGPAVAGADDAGHRSRGPRAGGCVRQRLVRRDRRPAVPGPLAGDDRRERSVRARHAGAAERTDVRQRQQRETLRGADPQRATHGSA